MGYSRITSWVESHFSPRDYKSYFEFEQAVKQRFNSDGIDLPKGAESEMMDYFAGYFDQIESPLQQQVIEPIPFDTYTPPEPEILQINEDFFTPQASSEMQTTQELPSILQPVSQPSTSQQPPTFFGKISGFFKRLFRI
jgi:hypothetical protein